MYKYISNKNPKKLILKESLLWNYKYILYSIIKYMPTINDPSVLTIYALWTFFFRWIIEIYNPNVKYKKTTNFTTAIVTDEACFVGVIVVETCEEFLKAVKDIGEATMKTLSALLYL